MTAIDSIGTPAFADPIDVILECFSQLRVPRQMTVSEAADKFRFLKNPGGGYTGPWKDSPEPFHFLDRPMDLLGSDSPYEMVCVMGPAQCGKSEIGNNWLLHTIVIDPADFIFIGPDKAVVHQCFGHRFQPMR